MRWPTLLTVGLVSLAASSRVCAEVASASDPLEEVIISAGRGPEPSWSVPLSVTTVTRTDLARDGIDDLGDLTQHVPGLSYFYGRGQGGTPVLRGMHAFAGSSNQNNVGTLIDGVYIANAFAVDVSMLDLDGVEVLRGPQNALLGRNAFAGAILYQTAAPTLMPSAGAQLDLGSDAYDREFAYVNGPLGGFLSSRLAVLHEAFDGTIHNFADSTRNLGGWEKFSVTASLLWQGHEGTHAQLTGWWFQNQRDATARFGFGDVPPLFNCGYRGGVGNVNYCGQIPTPAAVDISPDARGAFSQTALGRLELQQTFGTLTLTSLTAFIQTRLDDPPDDWDLSSAGELIPVALASAPDVPIGVRRANVYFTGFPMDDHEWSEDLRLTGAAPRLRWAAGVSWSDNRSNTHVGYAADGRALAPNEVFWDQYGYTAVQTASVVPYGHTAGRNRIGAAYGSFEYRFTSALDASAELRWSREEIYSQATVVGSPADPAQSGNWTFVTPRFTLQYSFPEKRQLYVSAARGARSGGFNDPSLGAEAEYGSETNWTYELGFKVGAGDGQVSGWVDVFLTKWYDLQADALAANPDYHFPITRNIGSATVKGLETSLTVRVRAWLDARVDYAFADARFDSGTLDTDIRRTCTPEICRLTAQPPSGALVPDVSGNQLPYAPRHSGTLQLEFHGALSQELHWYLRGGLYGASREFVRTDNLNWLAAQWLPSARLAVGGRSWELALWGRYLSSELHTGFATVALLDSGDPHFVADRANGASWGAAVSCYF